MAYLTQQLDSNGWITPPVNFGTAAATIVAGLPDEQRDVQTGAGTIATGVAPNTVAVTMGDEAEWVLHELGGGQYHVDMPVFVDVYGANSSVARSIASDVKTLLSERHIPLYDFTGPTPVHNGDDYIEFDVVIGPERPPASMQATDFKRYWRIVRGVATVYFRPVGIF